MSPVLKPCIDFSLIRYPRGNPKASTRVLQCDPRPVHLTSSTGCAGLSTSATSPTQAASRACPLGIPSRVRLNLVWPPVPVDTGKPVAFKVLKSTHRVALTAAASLSGALARARILFNRAGSLTKSRTFCAPFLLLQHWQDNPRLEMRLLPPLAFGTMCSICRGRSFLSQYMHSLPHFAKRYSRTS